MTWQGTVRNGRIEFETALPLPDGTPVRVEPVNGEPDPAYGLADEAVATGVPDLAAQHDHHLYGLPKREHKQG